MEPTPTPLCRCRVLYTGSSVPTIAKDGLQGIQEPLGKLYPAEGLLDSRGIDSWLSVWMNGLLLQYADNSEKEQFFPIESLHYCAAVRFVNICGYSVAGGGQQFLPLDSPFANLPDSKHPPVFAAILRRTTGVRVLECHAFVCTSPGAANALVRCCFHAYAENFLHNSSHVASLRRQHSGLKCPSEEKCDDDDDDDDDNNDNNDHTHHHNHHNGPTSNCSGRSSSPEASEIVFQNGYDSDTVNTWQRRQQAGDCDTASVSSSAAARYKKNKKLESKRGTLKNYPTHWSTQRLETNSRNPEVALLPYQRACSTADGRRRSRSETDLRFTTATRHPAEHALVPYVEPTAALLPYDQPAASSPASMTEPFPPPLPLTALVPYSHLFRPPFFPPRPTLAPLDRGPPPPPPPPLMFMPPVRAFPFLPPMLFPDQLPPSTPPRRKKRAKSGQPTPTLVPQPFAVMPPAAAPLPGPFFSFEEPPYASMASCRPFVDHPRLYGRFARSGSQPSLRGPDPTWPYPTAADPTLLPSQQDVLFDANSFFVDPPTLPYRPNSRFTNGQAYYSPLQPDFSARRGQQLGGGHFNQPPKVHKTNGGYSPDLEPKMQALQLNNPTRQMPKSSKSSSRTSKADVHLMY